MDAFAITYLNQGVTLTMTSRI